MSRTAVEGLEKLLQAGLEAGKGRLAAGDEEYAERFFVLGRAYDPEHRSRFAPWLEALAELRTIDNYLALAQPDYQAASRALKSLRETHQHRQALHGALEKRRKKVPRQASDDVKEIQVEELESWLAPVQKLQELVAELEGEEPYAARARITLLEQALRICPDALVAVPDSRLAKKCRAELQNSLQTAIRDRDSRWASSILDIAVMLLEQDKLDEATAMLENLASLDEGVRLSMAAQTEERQQQIYARRKEKRQKLRQQINRFTQRHRRWLQYELPKLIEWIETGELLSAQAEAVGVASAKLEQQLGEMQQRRNSLRYDMTDAWQSVEKKRFEQALRILDTLRRKGLTIIVGPNGEQEPLKTFMAKVLDEGDRHREVQVRSELKNAAALPDPRDGVKLLQDVLRNLPQDYTKSRRTAEEAIQTLQQRASRRREAKQQIQFALSQYDPADRLVRLMRAKEIYPEEHPYLDEEIVRITHQKDALKLAQQAQDCLTDVRSSLNTHDVSEAEARCNEAVERLQEAMEIAPEFVEQRFQYLSRRIERLSSDVEDAKRQSAHLAPRAPEGG